MYIAGFLFIIVFALAMIAGRILPPSVGKAADRTNDKPHPLAGSSHYVGFQR